MYSSIHHPYLSSSSSLSIAIIIIIHRHHHLYHLFWKLQPSYFSTGWYPIIHSQDAQTRAVPDHEFTGFRISTGQWIQDPAGSGYRIPISDCVKNWNFLIHYSLVITRNLGSKGLHVTEMASAKTGEGIYILQSTILYRKVVLKVVLNRIVNLPDTGYQISGTALAQTISLLGHPSPHHEIPKNYTIPHWAFYPSMIIHFSVIICSISRYMYPDQRNLSNCKKPFERGFSGNASGEKFNFPSRAVG